jgi:hypothetical protein
VTKKVSLNPDQPAVEDVWQYYEAARDSLVQMHEQAKKSALDDAGPRDSRFFGMDRQEINDLFEKHLEEADQQASLFLIAAAEAAFRVEFLQRVYGKKRDEVSRQFRDIFGSKRGGSRLNIVLEDDILDVWAKTIPAAKQQVGDFKGALHYRHWLAHGRYWVPKLGRRYDPAGILTIILSLFERISLSED